MKNLEQVKKEYKEFRERQYDIYKALDENAKEYSKDYKKSIYSIFNGDWYRDFVMEHLDAYSDEIDPNNFDEEKLYKEYIGYLEYEAYILDRRLNLYEENANWHREFKQWKKDVGFHDRFIQRDFDDCEKKFEGEWYGWDSNDVIFDGMMTTIYKTNEEEINQIVENARKVLSMIEDAYSESYVWDLDYINKKIRNNIFDEGATHVYVLDCLENDGMWDIYREPFKLFVERVINWIDSDFLFAAQHGELK